MPVSWLGASAVLSPISVCACVSGGRCKMRSTSWLEFKWFKAAPGQRSDMMFRLVAGWSWEFTSPSLSFLVHHGFSFLSPCWRLLPLQSSSSAACRGTPFLASGKEHFCCLFFLLFYFHLGHQDRTGMGAELWLVAWLPFRTPEWLWGRGWASSGGSASRKEGAAARTWGCAVRAGRRAEPGWHGCRLVQQPWQLRFWWEHQQWHLLTEKVFHAKKHCGVLAVSTNWGTKLPGYLETSVPIRFQ